MAFNEKQLQIIQTAEALFAEKGFDGTSVRDIAEAAGVNVAMISYYFGSKEKLLEALFTLRAGSTTQKLESMLRDKELTPLEKVNTLIDYFVEKFNNERCFHKLLMREQVSHQHTNTMQQIHHFKKHNQQLIRQIIQEGQKSGAFVKQVDVPILMGTLVGTIGHMVATQHYYRDINNLQAMPDEQFEKLIRKKLSTHLKFIFKAILTHEA
ncbi:MAG: TetR family transcriptional regulator [Ferruginibacter sp.]